MSDYLHSRDFVIDWNSGNQKALEAFYDEYWTRMYALQALYIRSTQEDIARRAVLTFKSVFKQSIGSFSELVDRSYRTARKLAFPQEDPTAYDPSNDRLDVEYMFELKNIAEKKFGPFEKEPTAEEWFEMIIRSTKPIKNE